MDTFDVSFKDRYKAIAVVMTPEDFLKYLEAGDGRTETVFYINHDGSRSVGCISLAALTGHPAKTSVQQS